ncbi:MAG: hypothetical protein UV65_C0035G0004 [Parcubacteria group bacterium GW2011_GWF2_43_11]|nr:MAG: hypothetical protein UV65_C0035G0004 [Parcubacteria group bacterium GW2011_GWF2_43_11]
MEIEVLFYILILMVALGALSGKSANPKFNKKSPEDKNKKAR